MTAPVPSVGDRIHVRVGECNLRGCTLVDYVRDAEGKLLLEVRVPGATKNVLITEAQIVQ